MRLIVSQRNALAGLLIAILVASGLAGADLRVAQAADGWTTAQRLTNNQIGLFPDIVIDSQNVTHVVYTQTPDFNTSRIVRYMNNRGGNWSAPFTLSAPGLFADLGRLSTVTLSGKVYLAAVYKAKTGNNVTSRIYYRLSSDGGATWGPQERITNAASYEPAIRLDDTGQPHVLFTYQPGSALDMAYSTRVNGAWTAPQVLNTGATAFNRDPSISYTRANGTLTLHAVFMGGKNGDESNKRIYSVRKVGAGPWEAPRQRQSNSGGGFPELVTDFQSKVYGVWQVNSSSYFYEPYFSRSLDNGTNWSTPEVVGSKSADIGEVPAIARTPSGKIAVLWEDQYRTSDNKRDVFARISEDDGAHWSGVKNISPSSGYSRNVAASANESGFQAVWHDERRGSYQIYFSTYAVSGGVVLPSATPVLDNGALTTRNATVTLSFTNVTGTPDSMRYHWDTAPTDADARVPFASPIAVPGPAGVTPDACQAHTLFTQLRRGTVLGPVTGDAELFDIGVQANVNILNPHLASVPATGSGVSDGDPNYTRDPSFYLRISGFTDCSGLSTFAVAGSANGPIANNFYANAATLPGGNTPGAHDISVEVKDGLGNTNTWQHRLIYDPANTDTSGSQPNTDGLPVLSSGGSVTADDANSVIRTLSFDNIRVNDNLYGQQPGLPQLSSGKQFWGMQIANTTSPTVTVDDPSLHWYAVRVPEPTDSFTVTWDIFSGLNIPYAELRNRPGDYHIFVRFLDGAGNASARSIKATATITNGYDVPTLRLPLQAR
jgi:hypothetical protein